MNLTPEALIWRRRVFTATWLSYAGYYFCRKPFYIAKASLGEELSLDASALGLMGMLYLAAYTVGQFMAGALGNRLGARTLLLCGMAVSVFANAAFGFTNSWGTFGVFLVVNGLAQATGWAGNVGSMATWFRRQERGTVMGIWATNYQVGGVAANALAAWTLGAVGYRWSFFTGSLVLCAAWLVVLLYQRDRPEDVGLDPIAGTEEDENSPHGSSQDLTWTRQVITNVLLVGVFYFFVKFIRYTLWSWVPYLLSQNYGMAPDEAGFLSTVFDLAGIGGVIVAGWLSDRVFNGRRAKISFFFILGMAASCGLLMAIGSSSIAAFGFCIGLVGFTLYGPDALMTGAGAIDVGNERGALLAAAIINGMGSVGSVCQEIVVGQLIDNAGITHVFGALLISAFCASAALGVVLIRNRTGAADL